MAKLNDMAAQMTTFSSILASVQKDVKELKTKDMGLSGVNEEVDEDYSMSDSILRVLPFVIRDKKGE